ncbi:MAG TPA: ABC transporter substrate-binding protein [Terriglobales bacterium]|jgi:NitT/TauT family transport system substrate-binding protein|nr:ABC transporter substrate-binding protein [Terriglobales bacterium]
MIWRYALGATLAVVLVLPNLIFAQEKMKFPVGVGTKTLGTSLVWVASKRGFFEAAGLDVQPVLLRGTPVAVQALVGESLYVAFGSADAMVSAAVGGADLVSVAGVINGLTQAIVAGKKYKTFKDLRGTTIGVQSLASGATTTLKRIFKKNGLDYPADYKLLAVGGGNFNLAALASGQVAAAFLVVPLVYAAEEQGMNVLGYYKDYIPNYQLTVMSVKRAWAERNRALLVRFITGALRANRWLFANKDAAVEFLAKEIQVAPDLARKGWEYYTTKRIWHPNLEINAEGMRVALDMLAEESKFTPPDPLKYIDRSYLQQALKESS